MAERLPCEDSMGVLRGREIQELITEATGESCPCREGKGCPLGFQVPAPRESAREPVRRWRLRLLSGGAAVALMGSAAVALTGGELVSLSGFPTWQAPISEALTNLHLFVG